MGQYYTPYIKQGKKQIAINNHTIAEDGTDNWHGLKLMEHSWFENPLVNNVMTLIYHKKGKVCWVGDYWKEVLDNQVNCKDRELITQIANYAENDKRQIRVKDVNALDLEGKVLVNHTKHTFIDLDKYFDACKKPEVWKGETYFWCVHPLPLLTCTESSCGGSYYGVNGHLCGTWFNDELEVIDKGEEKELSYDEVLPFFQE